MLRTMKNGKLIDLDAKETTNEVNGKTKLSPMTDTPFGRLNKEGNRNINFGSLANGAFKGDENYIKWQDGITPDEVNTTWIKELADQIAAIYGNDKFNVAINNSRNNVGIAPELKYLQYSEDLMTALGNQFDGDVLIEILSHEVGHQVIDNIGLEPSISACEGEACSDYIAGLTARLCNIDPKYMLDFFQEYNIPGGDYPSTANRQAAFIQGYTRIDRGEEAHGLKAFEPFSTYDFTGIYRNGDLITQILTKDVLTPMRNGDLEKIVTSAPAQDWDQMIATARNGNSSGSAPVFC